MFLLEGVSGILGFVFIGMELWERGLEKGFYGKCVEYNVMDERLEDGLWGIF